MADRDTVYQNVDVAATKDKLPAVVASGGNVYQDTSLGTENDDNVDDTDETLLQHNVSNDAKLENSNDETAKVEIEEREPDNKKCLGLRQCCHSCWKPVHTKYHPLPVDATRFQKFKHGFMCPPHGKLAWYLQFLILFAITWVVLISITHEEALPGGNFFSLVVLFYTCVIGGYLISFLRLPPLLGMLIIGAMLKNIPVIKVVGDKINMDWSGALRQIALTVILIRAGLGLDPQALRKLSCVVLRLAFSPCLAECVAEAIAAHFLLGFPWEWGFMLGFVLAAVSPAVVVPSLLSLSDRGYGLDKGIPTLVIAAASVDDVLAITGFGVVVGIAFSKGDLALTILKGPLEALLGVVFGVVVGVFLWYFPAKDCKNLVLYRTLLMFGAGLVSTFGSHAVELSGAGPLGCLTLAFVAAFRWRKETGEHGMDSISDIVGILWMVFQPLLFGLIGAAVNISDIDGSTVGKGLGTLCIGLVVRVIVSFLVVFGAGLTIREMMFVPIAWLPKATVQAAIGGIALDLAIKAGDKTMIVLGTNLLTIAVLSIIITAPVGAALIALFGPRLMNKTSPNSQAGDRKGFGSVELYEEIDIENDKNVKDTTEL